jgi:hypothetical protein
MTNQLKLKMAEFIDEIKDKVIAYRELELKQTTLINERIDIIKKLKYKPKVVDYSVGTYAYLLRKPYTLADHEERVNLMLDPRTVFNGNVTRPFWINTDYKIIGRLKEIAWLLRDIRTDKCRITRSVEKFSDIYKFYSTSTETDEKKRMNATHMNFRVIRDTIEAAKEAKILKEEEDESVKYNALQNWISNAPVAGTVKCV